MVIPIPPKIRAIIYWATAIVGVVLGGLAIWYQFTPDGAPDWLDTVTKLLLFLAATFGITSATNTLPVPDETALPPKVRRAIYWIFTIATIVVGALAIVYSAAGGTPTWVEALAAIVVFVGGAFGFTAASHVVTNPPPSDPAQPEVG